MTHTVYLPFVSASVPTMQTQLIHAINDHRLGQALTALVWESRLDRIAQAHAEDMRDKGFFSHTGSDGVTASERMTRAYQPYTGLAECLAAGYKTPAQTLSAWLASYPHRHVIEGPAYEHIGVGWAAGGIYGHYWVLNIGRE